MRRPPEMKMWAVIVEGLRSSWVHSGTVARTRRGAREKYLSVYADRSTALAEWESARKAGKVRLAKVTVNEAR